MFAELRLMGLPEPIPAAARSHVEHIRTATNHLDQLVEQVLTFSRLDAQRETVMNERVDLVALARETTALIEPLARQKGLDFGAELPAGPFFVDTDPNKLRRILFNLLGNAVKFTGAGEVRLALRVDDGHTVFEVRDTGIGIAPENHERVFEPFWQADHETISSSKGTGLGLGIVRRLVRLLRGEVEVESAPGQGSVFRVSFPLRQLDA
jgi:signal transduction histidine kinase